MTDPDASDFERFVRAATALHQAGRLAEAEAAYRAALTVSPAHPALVQNLGAVAAARNEPLAALAAFDAALAAAPLYALAHYNRAVLLWTLGRSREAIQAFERVCAIEPEHYEAHRALGFLWLAERARGRALDHFARTYELRRGDDRGAIARESLSSATRGKLLHDAAQFRFLAGRRRDGQRFESLARIYEEVAKDFPDAVAKLSDRQCDLLGEDYNAAIHICEAPEVQGRAVKLRPDRDEIVRGFGEARAGAVFFDDLLTEPALLGLRKYVIESTVWHDFCHISGFVASYLEDGLASPLLLQIADEMRDMFPELLREHPLSQAWAFKGLRGRAAVDAHADDAALSLNFWITPDAANRDPGGGGLMVCLAPQRAEWDVRSYDMDRPRTAKFLERHAGDILRVPYRENRSVLFDSRLVHCSDAPDFAPGYENQRINLTLLFGTRKAGRVGFGAKAEAGN